MTEINFQIEAKGDIERILQALAEDRWLDSAAKRIAGKLTEAQRQHYLRIAREVPYSRWYQGKTKTSGNVTAGGRGDKGYGIDTGALFDSLTPIVRDEAIIIESNIIYADDQESLLNSKGGSFVLSDEEALDVVAGALEDWLEVSL